MYKELSKDGKKELVNMYNKSDKGKNLYKTLNRLFFEGLFCLFSCVVIVIAIFTVGLEWWYWFFAGLTLFCGIVFVVGQHIIRNKEYNNFFKGLNKTDKNKLTKL